MVDVAAEECRVSWRGRAACAVTTLAAMAGLLLLDGQLGPQSFMLRRAGAAVVLAVIAALRRARESPFAAPGASNGADDTSPPGERSPGAVAPQWIGAAGASPRRCPQERSSNPTDWRRRVSECVAVIALLVLVARAPSVPVALVEFIGGLVAIGRMHGTRSSGTRLAAGLIPACISYVAMRFAVDLLPRAGAVADAIARAASIYTNRVRGSDCRLSFTALGGAAIALAVLYIVWSWRRDGGGCRLVAASIFPLGWFALLPVVTPDVSTGPITVFSRGAGHGLLWLAIAGVAGALLPRRQPASHDVALVITRRLPMAAAGIAAALAGVCLVGTGLIGQVARGSIRVHNYGGLDWDRPVYGRFGAFSGGMFGLLPVYCRAEGWDFGVIDHSRETASDKTPGLHNESDAAPPRTDSASPKAHADAPSISKGRLGEAASTGSRARWSAAPVGAIVGPAGASIPALGLFTRVAPRPADKIEPADLEKTQILILINSPKAWDSAQRRLVLDFVARGGSLLVLGDHTDVFGLMRGFNSLLDPLGIRFRFDSACKVRETWRGCQAAAPDAVAWNWDDENPGVAVGASLELSGSARPLLTGRYAFSDTGVRRNRMGSFLGNYHYDGGEQLGEVVLVATVTYGRGRVVVWGDTSAFQGVSSHYPAVVGPMLAWLSRPAACTELPPVRAAAALGLLAAVVWLWLVRGGTPQATVIAAGLLIGLAAPWCLSLPRLENARDDRSGCGSGRSVTPSGHRPLQRPGQPGRPAVYQSAALWVPHRRDRGLG